MDRLVTEDEKFRLSNEDTLFLNTGNTDGMDDDWDWKWLEIEAEKKEIVITIP